LEESELKVRTPSQLVNLIKGWSKKKKIFFFVILVLLAANIPLLVFATSKSDQWGETVTDCPSGFSGDSHKQGWKNLEKWCISGISNELPWRASIIIGGYRRPKNYNSANFQTGLFGPYILNRAKKEIGGHGTLCGAPSGTLVVPIVISLSQNIDNTPTGGTAPILMYFTSPGNFYTNPNGLSPGQRSSKTAVKFQADGDKCIDSTDVLWGTKDTHNNDTSVFGYVLLEGYGNYKKSYQPYLLSHMTVTFATAYTAPIWHQNALFLNDIAPSRIHSTIVGFRGPRITVSPVSSQFSWSKAITIQLLPSDFKI